MWPQQNCGYRWGATVRVGAGRRRKNRQALGWFPEVETSSAPSAEIERVNDTHPDRPWASVMVAPSREPAWLTPPWGPLEVSGEACGCPRSLSWVNPSCGMAL